MAMITRWLLYQYIKSISDPSSVNPSLLLPLIIVMIPSLGVTRLSTIYLMSSVALMMATSCEVPTFLHSPTNMDAEMFCSPLYLLLFERIYWKHISVSHFNFSQYYYNTNKSNSSDRKGSLIAYIKETTRIPINALTFVGGKTPCWMNSDIYWGESLCCYYILCAAIFLYNSVLKTEGYHLRKWKMFGL